MDPSTYLEKEMAKAWQTDPDCMMELSSIIGNILKRKRPETPNDDSVVKRPVQHPHAHLAGQKADDPIVALAQLVDRLPNVKKKGFRKRKHTPVCAYTGATSGTDLQRSTSMPDPQLSPQQMLNTFAPPQSPSQLSPGQHQQPLFSPMSQQGYPNNCPQSSISPCMATQEVPYQAWVQRASQNPANLQQQNSMLNAQLSQQAFYGGQPRFSNQQLQSHQMVVQSMLSPGSRSFPYSNPPYSSFHPPLPGVAMYQQQNSALHHQQAPQQRLQRTVSIPNRVNLLHGLPAGFTGGFPILSSQPSPVNFNPPVSTYNAPMPVSTALTLIPTTFHINF